MQTNENPQKLSDLIKQVQLAAKADSILANLTPPSEERSEVLNLLDQILDARSEKWSRLTFERLAGLGMVDELRDISRSMTLKVIIWAFLSFHKSHGRYPEMSPDSSMEEFTYAAWAYFFMSGPDPFAR